jgi:hypothetical protein
MAVKPTDGDGPAYVASRRAKVGTKRAAPVKKATAVKKAMPARSNKGGAVRGKARAAQVHAMNQTKRASVKVTPEARAVYMTMDGVPKTAGRPMMSPSPAGSARGSVSNPQTRTGGFKATPAGSARGSMPAVKKVSLGSSARKAPSPPFKRPQ